MLVRAQRCLLIKASRRHAVDLGSIILAGPASPTASRRHVSYVNITADGGTEMSYLTTHSTHFIDGYMASDI